MLIIATKNNVLVYKGRNMYIGEQQEQIQVNRGVQTEVIDCEQLVGVSG